MNSPHLHLLLNHIPVVGLGVGLIFWIVVIVKKYKGLEELVLGWFILIAIVAIFAFLTGEPAEESIEHLPGIKESIIENHEESAVPSLILIEILGLIALMGLLSHRRNHRLPSWLPWTVMIIGIAGQGFLIRTGYLGGQIRHPEILSNSVSSWEDTNDDDEQSEHERDDEDD